MNRLKFGLAATMLLGSVYAGFGLLISLRDFGVGLAVAAVAMVGYELIVYVENRRRDDEWLKEYRELIWNRREFGQEFWVDR